MKHGARPFLSRVRGYSLVEILVGIGIGMVAIVVIMQSLQVWEGQKRTSTSGADAQANGNIAIYELDRITRLGGMGFGRIGSALLPCVTRAYYSTRATPDMSFNLVPVEITSDTTTGRDLISVMYGDSPVMAHTVEFTGSTDHTKVAKSRNGFLLNDTVIVSMPGTPTCDLVQVTDVSNADGKTFRHDANTYNRGAGTESTYATGYLFNLGPNPQRRMFTIDSKNNLAWWNGIQVYSDPANAHDVPATATPVAENIMSLKAQYGMAATSTSAGIATWTTATPTDWTLVRAVRIGVLARSRQYEHVLKSDGSCCVDITTALPVWSGSGATPADAPFVVTNLDGSAGTTTPDAAHDYDNWKRYRYRVYESTIPLRNIIWGQSAL